MSITPENFSALQYGMFIHFGLFSTLARGEWVMNREQIAPAELEKIAAGFHPDQFNADALCDLAVAGGMKYIVFTTMHHEGFRMYDSALTPFNAKKFCGRDFVQEMVDAAEKHDLKLGLYHSLNNWHDQPDAVAALERPDDYQQFIDHTFARIRELVRRYPMDILWYDGWWPFNAEGWQAVRMNQEMRAIQPQLLFNGRNGLPGDFGTPEQHLTAPDPWRPWEACVTLNDHWGFHQGDHHWKDPVEVINMLLTCGAGHGNLLLNIGPQGDGSVPEESVRIVKAVGQWLREGGREAITNADKLKFSPTIPEPGDRGDWDANGKFAASGKNLFFILEYWPGNRLTLTGLNTQILHITTNGMPLNFTQTEGKIVIDLPDPLREKLAPVLKMECREVPAVYRTGGLRLPKCKHPRYDPLPPDIQYE